MVEELDMTPMDLRAAVYELRSKSHLAKWVKENFSGSTETENAERGDDEEYIPEDDGQSNDSKKGKGKGKKSNKEGEIVEKPFYFPEQGRFALSKAEKSKIFPASRTVSTAREATPKIDEAIMIHMEKAVRLSVARAAGHMIDPDCEGHKEFSTAYFENEEDNILTKQGTTAKGLSQDFAALLVAVGKLAISSTMDATDDKNPLTAAKNVRNNSVDLSPVQTQMAWISEGLCKDREAAKLIRKNQRVAPTDFIGPQSSDTAELQKHHLVKNNWKREIKYMKKMQKVMMERQFLLLKKWMIDEVETQMPMLPERFLIYAVCRRIMQFDVSHPFYKRFERLSWNEGVPPPGKDLFILDDKFDKYKIFCERYVSDPDNFNLEAEDFTELIKFFNDYPVSFFIVLFCLINSTEICRNAFLQI
jgi:hypothetical protein